MPGKSHHYKAFVSSTFTDLKEHRAHVIRQLRNAGISVDPMENWTADTDEPKQFSQDRLEGCDLCILLVAYRRGFVPEGETRSITQLEYEAAVKRGIDVLPFMLNDDALWRAKYDEREKDPELMTWRSEIQNRKGVGFFTHEPSSLDLGGALGRWFTKKQGSGVEPGAIEKVDWPKDKSPYPGLEWFTKDYAPLYYGRDREIDAVIGRMCESNGRFLIISGASGSGKSSLVGAGIWKALMQDERLPGSKNWLWYRMQPGDGESTPFQGVAWSLKQLFPKITERPDTLAKELGEDAEALQSILSIHLEGNKELVLFVDQLEELFTRDLKKQDIQKFLDHLIETSRKPASHLRILTTVRSEFLPQLQEVESVLEVLNEKPMINLGPISPVALADMVTKPAEATGYEFEPGLVEEILRDAAQEPGNLPLVAYTLKQLFERRDCERRMFTNAAYQALGGVAGAIGTKADEMMEKFPAETKEAFNRVFAELVHIERDGPPTRKRVMLSRFQDDAEARALIDALAGQDCRVLVTGKNEREATVEVAHEKLFSAWSRLKDWVEQSRGDIRKIEHAIEEACRWREQGEQAEELWPAYRANEVLDALEKFGKSPSPELARFLRPQEVLCEQLHRDDLKHKQRVLIGWKLASFGDPRPGVGLREDGLPDIAWIEIPGGQVKLENVGHVFEVKPFFIAKFPVTNAQFEAFLKAEDGYHNETWWQGFPQPEDPLTPAWAEANCPRETVSWYEAMAFCRWLGHRTELRIRLPTEWEWQEAATGGDSTYEYPWGKEWDSSRCNSGEAVLYRTSSVGIYLNGETQQGVLDMAGNVWEWCFNTYDNPQNPAALDLESNESRVRRGGSWNFRPVNLRSSSRDRSTTDTWFKYLGFRLAQDIP